MSTRVKIRPIKLGGVLRLRKLFKKALHQDFSYFPGENLEEVEMQNSIYRLAKASLSKKRIITGLYDNKVLVGYIIANIEDPRENYIFWMYVRPEFRGGGIGSMLFDETLNSMKLHGASSVYLITRDNEKFYKSFGFETINLNNDLFDGVSMHEMAKDL